VLIGGWQPSPPHYAITPSRHQAIKPDSLMVHSWLMFDPCPDGQHLGSRSAVNPELRRGFRIGRRDTELIAEQPILIV
jgi:hypothetical protein